MNFPILARVRWRSMQWLLPLLLIVFLANDIRYTHGAPQSQARSGPQRQQNPSQNRATQFRVIPDFDDLDDLEEIVFNNARQRGFNIRNGQASGSSSSFGVPLGATGGGVSLSSSGSGARQETMNAARAHFGVPVSAARPGRRQETQSSGVTFGVPLSSTRTETKQAPISHFKVPLSSRSGVQQTSNTHFGIPLSETQSANNQQISQTENAQFGVPLGAIHSANNQQISQAGKTHFGVPLSATPSRSHQETSQVGRSHIDVAARTRSHFTPVSHKPRLNSGRFFITDDNDNVSFEDINNSLEVLSLGRRFHPEGIPKRSDVTLSNAPLSSSRTVISNPFFFTSDVASAVSDSSLEDDDDDTFIVLSPMVKAYNPSAHNERLSLSNDFLSQYNYVDVQGTTNWGYKTDDQYQEHQVHNTGTMQGKFGWTSPEGSQVNIKYIADEGGYRVLSSSGIYTKDEEEVSRLKKIHLAEHEKARINHQNIKDERRKGSVGIPLPTQLGDTQPSDPSSGSSGFVIIPDDDDFPLVPSRTSGSFGLNADAGVPLPTLGTIQPGLDVGVFIDSTSASGVPLPTTKQEGTSGFGIPLSDPATSFVSDTPSHATSPGFGIPLPDPSVNQVGASLPDSTFTQPSDQGFGVPLSDPTLTSGADAVIPSSGQGFGVALPDPTLTSGADVFLPSSGQGFGVALPDSHLTFESGQPSMTSIGHEVGVPLSDITHALDQGTGVSLSTGIRDTSMPIGDHGVGVPLSSATPTFGIEDPATSIGQDMGVSFHGKPVEQSVGTSVPGFSFTDGHGGVPLPDFTPTVGFGESAVSPVNEGFGVSLPDPNLGFESGQPSTSFTDPIATMPSRTSTDQGNTLPGGTETFETGKPLSTSSGQELKVTLLDSQGTFDSGLPHSTLGSEFGVPLSGTVSNGGFPSQNNAQPTETFLPGQDFGIPLVNPMDVFGLQSVSPSDQIPTSPAIGSSAPDATLQPTDAALPNQDFGVPLMTPTDVIGAIPLSPSDHSLSSPTAESVPFDSPAPGTHSDSHSNSFGLPLFPTDTMSPSFSPPTGSVTHSDPNQGSFGVSLFQEDGTFPSAGLGPGSPNTVEMNEISNFGIPLDQGPPHFASSKEPSLFDKTSSKTPSPTLIDRSNTQSHPSPQPETQETFGVPLDFNPATTPIEVRPGQSGGNFFIFPDSEFSGLPQGTGVGLGGVTNTLPTGEEPTPQGGHQFGDHSNVGVPLSPTSFPGGDFLQGPPVEQLDPSQANADTALSNQGLDPCLNSKIHPALLPPECANRKTEPVEPSQNIGKSLLSSSSKSEPTQDSFIVVVNSDIFQ